MVTTITLFDQAADDAARLEELQEQLAFREAHQANRLSSQDEAAVIGRLRDRVRAAEAAAADSDRVERARELAAADDGAPGLLLRVIRRMQEEDPRIE